VRREAALGWTPDGVDLEGQAEQPERGRHHGPVADHDGLARSDGRRLRERLRGDLGADAGRVAHGDAEDGTERSHRAAPSISERNRSGGPKPPALVSSGSLDAGSMTASPSASPLAGAPDSSSRAAPTARRSATAVAPPVTAIRSGRESASIRAASSASRDEAVSRASDPTAPASLVAMKTGR